MRLSLVLVASMLAALAFFTDTAAAKERCCFSAYISGVGVLESSWGQLSNEQIGGDKGDWAWRERMILVYSESGSTNFPGLRLARLGKRVVKPSTVSYLKTTSTVQFGGPGFYRSVTEPGDCGTQRAKVRLGDTPVFEPRSGADAGVKAAFSNAKWFLGAGDSYLAQDRYCLYGHNLNNIETWDDQACVGQRYFWLPAPRRTWFRHGKGFIEKEIQCDVVHEPEVNVNHRTRALGIFKVRLAWFPPSQLKERAQDLKQQHRQTTPGEGPH
jgi:hypothetical protein